MRWVARASTTMQSATWETIARGESMVIAETICIYTRKRWVEEDGKKSAHKKMINRREFFFGVKGKRNLHERIDRREITE